MIKMIKLIWVRINKFESVNPDTARKGRLLNVLLTGTVGTSILALVIAIAILSISSGWDDPGNALLLLTLVVFSVAGIGLLVLNQYSVKYSSFLFLAVLTIMFAFSDTPEQISNGRSSFVFFIPIAVSSLLLAPASSFIFAIVGGILMTILAHLDNNRLPNIPTIISSFSLALVSWLSSRSLEQALKDLRTTNAELDHRVEDRTRELSDALSRETIEAGRREAILNSIADGVVVFDRNGTAILANPSIAHLLNKPQEKIIGSGLNDLLASNELKPGDRGKIAALLEKSAHELSNFRVQLGKKTLSVNAADVRDDKNRPIGTVAVLRDFTNEAELEQMKNTFIAIVSHELRTPLNAILGYAEMLKEAVYGQVNEKQKNASARIMMNAQRLIGIVTDLLDQAQIEAGKLKIQVMPCKPAELLDNLHGVMDKIVSDKNIDLITELDPAMPATIIGDPQRLQQILVNLTNNAVKFTDRGSIHVKIRPNHDGKTWQIQTLDTGSGIPDDAREYIFETFRQVEGASTREHGGVGLGLAIVKQLVELMNGKVTVESEIAKGSTFTVTLPLIPHEATN
jgi:PAS domain S-box-containing protein